LFAVNIVTDHSEIWLVELGGTVEQTVKCVRWKDTITVTDTFPVLFSSEPTRSRLIRDVWTLRHKGRVKVSRAHFEAFQDKS
jgi:hypothetical protein